ncbi:MAG: carbohydrate kinase family protein [Candidatus Neomarinimicrobiota bacterium]
MLEKEINVVVAGHICLDMFPEFMDTKKMSFEELFVPGKLTNVSGMRISTGGPVSNTGIAMHNLGAKISLIAKIGDDFIGEAILNFLKNKVSVEGIKIVKGELSSYTIVIAPKDIDRMFLHNPGTNDTFCYDDIDFDLVRSAKLFHLGYPPLMKRLYQDDGEQLRKIYKRVNELGVITSLDFALPDPNSPSGKVNWNKILKKVLPYIDIFLPSVEEAQFVLDKEKFLKLRERAKGKELLHLFDGKELTQLSNKLLDYGTKIVGLKCGNRGFYVKTASEEKLKKIGGINLDNWSERQLWEPTYHVEKFASAAGAGDSAIAAFLVALLKGETIEMCLKYACMCGAQNVQALDTVSGIKNWAQTTREIKSGWGKNELKIKTVGWRYNRKEKLWHGPEDMNRKRSRIYPEGIPCKTRIRE